MVNVTYTSPEVSVSGSPMATILQQFGYGTQNDRLLYLFAAQGNNPNNPNSLTPVDQFAGVPSSYLINVINPNQYALIAAAAMSGSDYSQIGSGGSFSLSMDGGAPVTIQIPATTVNSVSAAMAYLQAQINAAFPPGDIFVGQVSEEDSSVGLWLTEPGGHSLAISNVEGSADWAFHLAPCAFDLKAGTRTNAVEPFGTYTLTISNSLTTAVSAVTAAAANVQSGAGGDRPVAIPLGDLTGDGYDDYIGATYDSGTTHLARIFFGDR